MTWRWALRGVCASAALCILLACAKGEDGIDIGGAASGPDGGGGDARLSEGGGGGRSDATAGADGGGGGCNAKVVINELQNDGANGAEFVELFNSGACAVSLDGWSLGYRSDEDKPGTALYAFEAADSIGPGDFLVLGSGSFGGAKQGTLASGMGNSGGQVGLLDADGNLIDAVGYGTGTKGQYTEGTAAPVPSSNGSIARKTDGEDSGDNASDFAKATPSPGKGN